MLVHLLDTALVAMSLNTVIKKEPARDRQDHSSKKGLSKEGR